MVTFGAEPADEAGRARNVVTSDLLSLKINSSSTGSWQFSVNCMPSGPQSIRVVRAIHQEWPHDPVKPYPGARGIPSRFFGSAKGEFFGLFLDPRLSVTI
jgi:hypothetical protein